MAPRCELEGVLLFMSHLKKIKHLVLTIQFARLSIDRRFTEKGMVIQRYCFKILAIKNKS